MIAFLIGGPPVESVAITTKLLTRIVPEQAMAVIMPTWVRCAGCVVGRDERTAKGRGSPHGLGDEAKKELRGRARGGGGGGGGGC